MGIGRKKSHYITFGELAKTSGAERAESVAPEAGFPATYEDDYDATARLSDIEARVLQARRHINNARVEAIAYQEASRDNDVPTEPTESTADATSQTAPQGEFIEPAVADEPVVVGAFQNMSAAPAAPAVLATSLAPINPAESTRYVIDDIDEADVESIERSFFEERPVSIEESMRQIDEAHARRQKGVLVFALIATLLVAGIGLVVFGLTGASDQNGESAESGAQGSSQDEASVLGSTSIARRYQTDEYGEDGVSIYEVIEFDEGGLCDKVTLKATFSNAAAAKEFLADMREAHGADCMESYVSGTTGVVVIDVSNLGMTEEECSATAIGELVSLNTQEVPAALVAQPKNGDLP